jgi:pimeloyl-ACP methyl ester carboxylesterase
MPRAKTQDGYELYYETAGSGVPIIFVHEFAGDHTSWEGQLRHFGKTHLCISFSSRGFSPSDVPTDPAAYDQMRAVDDIAAVLDAATVDKAHVVGLSMGAIATLHFGIRHRARVRSLCLGGCGYGADLDKLDAFRARSEQTALAIETMGMADFARVYATGIGRVQFETKDKRGYDEFLVKLAGHDAVGAAMTQRYLQGRRPSIYTLENKLKTLDAPTLIMVGDEDTPCLQPGLFLKRTIRTAALGVIPNAGHSINLEEPEVYNEILARFLAQVDAGRWPSRDDRADMVPDLAPGKN